MNEAQKAALITAAHIALRGSNLSDAESQLLRDAVESLQKPDVLRDEVRKLTQAMAHLPVEGKITDPDVQALNGAFIELVSAPSGLTSSQLAIVAEAAQVPVRMLTPRARQYRDPFWHDQGAGPYSFAREYSFPGAAFLWRDKPTDEVE